MSTLMSPKKDYPFRQWTAAISPSFPYNWGKRLSAVTIVRNPSHSVLQLRMSPKFWRLRVRMIVWLCHVRKNHHNWSSNFSPKVTNFLLKEPTKFLSSTFRSLQLIQKEWEFRTQNSPQFAQCLPLSLPEFANSL
jgi:hypothetical protein